MKKISFLIDDITCSGGTERVTCTLSNQLSKLGYDVDIFTIQKTNLRPFFPLSESVKIRNIKNKNYLSSLHTILSTTKKERRCLIVISMGKLSVIVAMMSLFIKQKKIIFSEHITISSFSFFKRMIKKMSYIMADYVVFLTHHDKDFIAKHNSKYQTIENIDPYHDYSNSISNYANRDNIALAIGRFGYQKNFERLIELWRKANLNDWKLIIIGKGNANLLSKIHPSDNIIIENPTKHIDSYYNNSKLLLMTSRYEGLPMVLIESQHFGIPAISFDCKTGPKEIIKNNETGYIIGYNDDVRFINTIKELTSDNENLYRMHLNSIKNSSHYGVEKIISKWILLIDS